MEQLREQGVTPDLEKYKAFELQQQISGPNSKI